MAKLKRYELYEGDDDLISPSLPGKQPLGRDEGLKARDEYDRKAEEETKKRRYFAANEQDDGLGAPSSLFDDFDRFETQAPSRDDRPKYRRKDKNRGAWAAVIVTCLLILAAAALVALGFLQRAGRVLAPALVAAALLLLAFGSNWDRGFHTVLRMERAVGRQDWDKVLQLAEKQRKPNRVHVLYRDLALYAKGLLTEKLFQYPDGDEPLHTRAQFPISYVCAAPVLYYTGMLNPCDRLAMEYSSTFCKNIHFYKYQAKTALASGEYELARKYLDLVGENWFEGAWVRRYRAVLEDPARMDADPEYQRLRPLLQNAWMKFEAAAPLQEMLYVHFANPDYVNEAVFEWQAAFALIQKDAEQTLQLFFDRLERLPDAPVGTALAEGVALFASEAGDVEMMRALAQVLAANGSVLKRFSQFSTAANSTRDFDAEKTKERFFSHYGRTFWYYYLYIDINTNR